MNISGKAYFTTWFQRLSPCAAARITAGIHKMENGNLSNTKFLKDGVWEFKINSGPGYRIYFGKVGRNIVLLLTGGTKRAQHKDIQLAVELLKEYKKRSLH